MEIGQFCEINKDIIVDVRKHTSPTPVTAIFEQIKAGTKVVVCEFLPPGDTYVVVSGATYRYEVHKAHLDEVELVGGTFKKIEKSYESIW